MKIAVIGDIHLISDADPYKKIHTRRAFFKSAWPSFQQLIKKVNEESPDITILLGDLVDWHSPENISFGLDLMSALDHPWQMTPGNHDIAAPSVDFDQADYGTTATRDHLEYWIQQDVDLTDRIVDVEGCRLILLDSAISTLAEGAEHWLGEAIRKDSPNLLFTHVPIDLPETRDYILSVDSKRSMIKYVLSGAPNLYANHIQGKISHVFSGHLHFAGDLAHDITRFHLCNMGISMNDPHRKQGSTASAKLIKWHEGEFSIGKIEVDE